MMQVVALPMPPDRIPLPRIDLVTGASDEVELRPVPLGTWARDPIEALPLSPGGQAEVERRRRNGLAIAAVSVILGLGLPLVLRFAFAMVGPGRFLALITIVVGLIVARTYRQRTLHAVSRRGEILVLSVPSDEAAEALRRSVEEAELPDDLRARLESAQQLASIESRRHPIAR